MSQHVLFLNQRCTFCHLHCCKIRSLTPQKMCPRKIPLSTGPLDLVDQKFSLGQENSSTAFRDYEGQTLCSDSYVQFIIRTFFRNSCPCLYSSLVERRTSTQEFRVQNTPNLCFFVDCLIAFITFFKAL